MGGERYIRMKTRDKVLEDLITKAFASCCGVNLAARQGVAAGVAVSGEALLAARCGDSFRESLPA
jgi:hypothetical protein